MKQKLTGGEIRKIKREAGLTGKPLTKKEMYDKDDNCILPKSTLRRLIRRSKYFPEIEDKKHNDKKATNN